MIRMNTTSGQMATQIARQKSREIQADAAQSTETPVAQGGPKESWTPTLGNGADYLTHFRANEKLSRDLDDTEVDHFRPGSPTETFRTGNLTGEFSSDYIFNDDKTMKQVGRYNIDGGGELVTVQALRNLDKSGLTATEDVSRSYHLDGTQLQVRESRRVIDIYGKDVVAESGGTFMVDINSGTLAVLEEGSWAFPTDLP